MKLPITLAFLCLILGWCDGQDEVVRETRQGRVRGRRQTVLNVTVEVYKGIPFAEPPVGNLRFRPPVARSPWEGTYDATGNGTGCPQVIFDTLPKEYFSYSEDCLHLNVWAPTPQAATRAPVFVWIHGGGFSYESSASDWYNGVYLSALSGLVVVSMNYRLGILGFLNGDTPDAPGNVGLLDQLLALKWIQDNVEVFGGDPSVVTIAGESAGSMSVHAHVLSPMSRDFFKRAIMMSGTANNLDFFDTVGESVKKGNDVAKVVGCAQESTDLISQPYDVIQCLRQKSADELVDATTRVTAPKVFTFMPTYNDQFMPYPPIEAVERGFYNNVDIMTGITSDEGALALIWPSKNEFAKHILPSIDKEEVKRSVYGAVSSWIKAEIPEMLDNYESQAYSDNAEAFRRAYLDYLSDRMFICPTQFFAEKHSSRGNSVYLYVFGHKARKLMLPQWMGTPHALEIFFFFAKPFDPEGNFTEEDKVVSEEVVKAITAFCKHGVPLLPNGDAWKKFTSESRTSIYISYNNFTETPGFRKEECERWRRFI